MRFAALGFFLLCGALGARLAVAGYFFDLDSAAAIDRAANLVESAEYAERLAALDPEGAGRPRLRDPVEPAIERRANRQRT